MNAAPKQFPLEFTYRQALGREDFLVTPSNAAAVGWIDAWPGWPVPALALTGPPGSGKSHLAGVWRQRSGAVDVSGTAVRMSRVEEILSLGSAFVVETPDQAEEEALLHLYNATLERGGHLLLVNEDPPARWLTALPDLASRLRALPVAEIGPPDDQLFGAVLGKLFADRQMVLPADVAQYLVMRLERSFAAARHIVPALDAAALAGHRPITIPLAREVLSRLAAEEVPSETE